MSNGTQLFGAVLTEVRALGEVLAKQTVCVLVTAPLPGALRIAEVDIETCIEPKLRVLGHLGSLIPGQRAPQMGGQFADRLSDGIPDGFGAVAGQGRSILDRLTRPVPLHSRQVQEHGEAGCAFDQRADRRAAEAENEVAFPMAWNSPVTDLSRAIADHQGIGDKGFAAAPGALAGQPECAPGAKTG